MGRRGTVIGAHPRHWVTLAAVAPEQRWFVYLARCADATLYTGIARNVANRLAAHNAGRGARYTKGRGPVELCATRRCDSKSEALQLEYSIKRLPRSDKERLTEPRRLGAFARRFFG
jgi:putative endonuclease